MYRPSGVPAAYARELARHGYVADPAQQRAVERLEALRLALEHDLRRERSVLGAWMSRFRRDEEPAPVRGLYLWGGVGRGKTFLMDLFHAELAVPSRRVHFHRFMHEAHALLRERRALADPLVRVAADMAADSRVICFDELFVSDVADAMILAGLFEGLIRQGVTLLFTSNVPPQELYRDGLQRQRFIPAIELIEQHAEVLPVDGGTDYRLRELERAPLYISTRTGEAEALLAERFAAIAGQPGEDGGTIEVESRQVPVRRRAEGTVWFDFADLCGGPRSQADYIEIARTHHSVFISGVPRFDSGRDDEARRFISLVDEFYDRGVKLVVTADAPPAELYQGERLAFEFARTASRLAEMQTHAYLERPHRP
jgi:cell division protein ZapE